MVYRSDCGERWAYMAGADAQAALERGAIVGVADGAPCISGAVGRPAAPARASIVPFRRYVGLTHQP